MRSKVKMKKASPKKGVKYSYSTKSKTPKKKKY